MTARGDGSCCVSGTIYCASAGVSYVIKPGKTHHFGFCVKNPNGTVLPVIKSVSAP